MANPSGRFYGVKSEARAAQNTFLERLFGGAERPDRMSGSTKRDDKERASALALKAV